MTRPSEFLRLHDADQDERDARQCVEPDTSQWLCLTRNGDVIDERLLSRLKDDFPHSFGSNPDYDIIATLDLLGVLSRFEF